MKRSLAFRLFVCFAVFGLAFGEAKAQSVLFDFDNAPLHAPLPIDLTVGGITAHFSSGSPVYNYSIQRPSDVIGFTPVGFSGFCISPSTVFASDLLISFGSTRLANISIMYSPEEYATDSSCTMRITAYLGTAFVGTNTFSINPPGTWPTGTLSLSSVQPFDNVVIHYDAPPITGGDYGPIFMADNLMVNVAVATPTPSPTPTPTVVLPPSKDNTLYQDATGQLSNGQGPYLYAGQIVDGGFRRGLIAFDLSAIPTNATVTAATLSMYLNRTGPVNASNISVSRMLRDWGEGASNAGDPGGMGAPAQTGDATWLHNFYNTSFWTTPGGEFSSTPSATTAIEIWGQTYLWSSPGLLANVQAWVSNPASNFGWVILGNEVDLGTAARFGSREHPTNPPRLNIAFQLPGQTPTPTPTTTPTPGVTPPPTPPATPSPTTTPTPTPASTTTPTATPSPTPSPTPTVTPTLTPTPSPAQALNISTRMQVETGNNVLIAGFIITGTAPKNVVVRGIGPSLGAFGVPDALADPTLELRDSNGALILANDNWQDDSVQAAQLSALGLALPNPNESGLVATLQPGAYTAILAGKNQTTGVGLVEVYDANSAANSQLGNISTRGFVLTGNDVMIGGFILGGNSNTHVVVRGIGPSLAQFGLNPVLADPTLELHDSNGATLVMNDDWQDDPASASQLSFLGLAPSDTKESGIYTSLPPGSFTAILAGKSQGIGIGLVEIYNVH